MVLYPSIRCDVESHCYNALCLALGDIVAIDEILARYRSTALGAHSEAEACRSWLHKLYELGALLVGILRIVLHSHVANLTATCRELNRHKVILHIKALLLELLCVVELCTIGVKLGVELACCIYRVAYVALLLGHTLLGKAHCLLLGSLCNHLFVLLLGNLAAVLFILLCLVALVEREAYEDSDHKYQTDNRFLIHRLCFAPSRGESV